MNSVPMYYKEGTKFRFVEYPTLAIALASNQRYGYGTILFVKGDTTRFKVCIGSSLSAKNPAVITALTFAQLPWISSGGSKYSGPTSDTTLAVNVTATLTGAQLAGATYITSTSAAAVTLTLPTCAQLVAALLALGYTIIQGSEFIFTIDNSGGANTITVAVASGIVVGAGALTGNTTLTLAAGQFAKFSIIFKSNAAALLYRTL